jgi:hypothetical protein
MLADGIIILGLVVFEIVSSIDNAIVNAHILKTMGQRARKWFLLWGMFFAVFVARGILPFLIVWLTTPGLGFMSALVATFGNGESAQAAIEASSYILLTGGGMFLLLLYFHWLFLEKKDPYFVPDKLIKEHHGVWFFAIAALLLVAVLYITRDRPLAMIAAATGNAVFFILYGFRETAEKEEAKLEKGGVSDLAKLAYLEVLDLSFSIDAIFGAFAFTTHILLILIGNGIGAIIVRELTIKGVDKVGNYRWLKNGAMTSIGFLGAFMTLEAFGLHIPEWVPTFTTCFLVGVTFWESHRDLGKKST